MICPCFVQTPTASLTPAHSASEGLRRRASSHSIRLHSALGIRCNERVNGNRPRLGERCIARYLAAGICGCIVFASVTTAQQAITTAQQPATTARPYDGIQAGLDAFRLGEEQRQGAVGQQLFLNDTMRWNGYPTSGVSNTYYGYMPPAAIAAYGYGAPLMARANLNALYGYNGTLPWGAWQSPGGPIWVFQPWPYIPGDIWAIAVTISRPDSP